MTFHAPHSNTKLVRLLLQRTLLSRSAVIAVGAVVTTTVVLAGRGPDNVTGLVSETRKTSMSSLAPGHSVFPRDSAKTFMADATKPFVPVPSRLVVPGTTDFPLIDGFSNSGDTPVAHVIPDFAKLQALEEKLTADLGFSDSSFPPRNAKPRNIEVASLRLPDADWKSFESALDTNSPSLERAPARPSLSAPETVDSIPEIGGLEAGPVVSSLTATSGETLDSLLTRAGLSENDRKATLIALRADNITESFFEGDVIDIALLSADDNQLLAIRLRQRDLAPVELRWDGDTDPLWASLDAPAEVEDPVIAEVIPEPETLSITGRHDDTVLIEGEISSSLFSSAAKAGLTAGETKALSEIFRYSVDFGRDLRKGDHFEALFEKKSNGAYGDILYAKLTNRGSEIALYRGVDDVTGEIGYFDATGKTNKRSLMRTPVAGAQVSSHFGMRKHPILGYSKMHRGTDFRARRGTPIFAAGDGIVDSIGRKGAYGEYIRIRHNSTYETAYAHMSGYAAGLNYGDRVRQGDVIGYVGTTGRSTGPHLHFEIIKDGNQINPLEIADFGPVRGLSGPALSGFLVRVSRIEIALTLMRNNSRLATAQ